jgi:type I restriction enzyme, S subunit
MSSKVDKRVVPELRFPDFLAEPAWEKTQLENLVVTVTPPQKIPVTGYLERGTFPIIDQSQKEVAGWTNDPEAVIHGELPLIVFGDHTCVLKLVIYPFAQGADGIKILKGNTRAQTEFIFHALQNRPVATEEYKRHFSILKSKELSFPENNSGEQQKIANCLSSLDGLITAQAQKIETLKTQKKGLMQQLFPAEWESVPRLRIPSFRQSRNWDTLDVGEVLKIGTGRDYKHLSIGSIPVYGSGGFMLSVNRFLFDGKSVCIDRKGTIDKPIFLSGKFWTVDTLFYTHSFRNCLPEFIYRIFQSIEWLKYSEASGVPSLSKQVIEKIKIKLPDLAEQRKIVECIDSLDELVAACAQELEVLRMHKSGLMQGLFPDIERAAA